MRLFAYLLGSLVVSVAAAQAQDTTGPATPCVEVRIGQDSTSHINCVNETLRRAVEYQRNAPSPEAPITARSASNVVGTFNDAAARQMMGNAFGVSAVPQRPKNTFTSPLLPAPR